MASNNESTLDELIQIDVNNVKNGIFDDDGSESESCSEDEEGKTPEPMEVFTVPATFEGITVDLHFTDGSVHMAGPLILMLKEEIGEKVFRISCKEKGGIRWFFINDLKPTHDGRLLKEMKEFVKKENICDEAVMEHLFQRFVTKFTLPVPQKIQEKMEKEEKQRLIDQIIHSAQFKASNIAFEFASVEKNRQYADLFLEQFCKTFKNLTSFQSNPPPHL